jgi:hypothetical protein
MMQSQYPGISNLASQIEMFGMSKREIEAKFTKSEMVLLAWRSQEMSYKMSQETKKASQDSELASIPGKSKVKKRKDGVPDWVPDHLINEEGDVDLRLATGKEAHKFFSMQGIVLPVIKGD